MNSDAVIFWLLAIFALGPALAVILMPNPMLSAISLLMSMVGISSLFVTLGAYFLAGVQLIVYAGALTVLFVMVLMLFDLKEEVRAFSHGTFSGTIKLATVGLLGGLIIGAVLKNPSNVIQADESQSAKILLDSSKALGQGLFTRYFLGFEVLGVLLLVVAVGTVALSRSKGGTHAKE